MSSDLHRTHFSISRASEYFDAKELEAQTGRSRRAFASVVTKELLDNSLDACETSGVAPEIEITVERDDDVIRIRVGDNGPGLPSDVLERILDFDTRTSDKSRYRAPTRGAQGNALKTVVGIPKSLGGDAPIIIEACGQRHTIRPEIDAAGNVEVDDAVTSGLRTVGTTVEVTLPAAGQVFDPGRWAREFALCNPHAAFSVRIADRRTMIDLAQSDATNVRDSYQNRVDFPGDWRKWRPSDPTSPHWYDTRSLTALVDAEVAHGRATKSEGKLLRDFVREFSGLTSTGKAKQITEKLPHARRVDDLNGDVGALLAAMQDASTPPKPDALGSIGEEPIRACIDDWCGIRRHWYHKERVLDGGTPIIVEAFVAETEVPGGLTTAVNFSPTFGDPLSNEHLDADKANGFGVAGLLRDCAVSVESHWYLADSALPTYTAMVHIVSPNLAFLDRGKSRVDASPALVKAATKAIWRVAKTAWADNERREKDTAAYFRQRQSEDRARTKATPKMSVKDAAFARMEQAWAKATGNGTTVASVRTLFYQLRPLVQQLTNKPLKDSYLTQNLLPEYQRTVRRLPGIYYEPRGTLHEPHSGTEVQLGTQEVDRYRLPSWSYDKILYIEKQGLWPVLEQAQLGERYDMAIIAGNGFASVAARTLLAQVARNCTIFVLHDADPAGYNIGLTLREETARMPEHRINVIDIGLTLDEAVALGLETETFERSGALQTRLADALGETERRMWKVDASASKRNPAVCQRVELNAMTTPQLIAHVTAALERHGATAKVVPNAATIDAEAASRVHTHVGMRLDELFRDFIPLPTIATMVGSEIAHVAETLTPEEVRAAIEPARPVDWKVPINNWAARVVRQADERIVTALAEALREAIDQRAANDQDTDEP